VRRGCLSIEHRKSASLIYSPIRMRLSYGTSAQAPNSFALNPHKDFSLKRLRNNSLKYFRVLLSPLPLQSEDHGRCWLSARMRLRCSLLRSFYLCRSVLQANATHQGVHTFSLQSCGLLAYSSPEICSSDSQALIRLNWKEITHDGGWLLSAHASSKLT